MTENSTLAGAIRAELRNAPGGRMTFARFMELALYHPDHGYYASAVSRTGRSGDFFTSVSVGACFGMLLARHVEEVRERLGGGLLRIVEQGANDGRLAEDILDRLNRKGTDYVIVEPLASLRRVQEERLKGAARVVSRLGELDAQPTVFIGNELLDAFPVHRIRYADGGWKELYVGMEGDRFVEVPGSPSHPSMVPSAEGLPEGYTAEVRPRIRRWIAGVASIVAQGVVTLVDYGWPRSAFHALSRKEGTLRCYRNHVASDDPFVGVGETDITAHVDFTQLARAGMKAGLDVIGFADQAQFFVGQGEAWLREIESEGVPGGETSRLLRQFQTLTHPNMMGRVFHVLGFGKGLPDGAPLSGFRHATGWRETLEL